MDPFGVTTPIMFFRLSVTSVIRWSLSFGTLIMVLSRAVLAILTLFKASGLGGLTSTNSSLLRSTNPTFHLFATLSTPATLKALKVSANPLPSPIKTSFTPRFFRNLTTPSMTLLSVVIPVDGWLASM